MKCIKPLVHLPHMEGVHFCKRCATEEISRLRDIICLLEDSRIRGMSMFDRPDLFDDIAQVFEQRNEERVKDLPVFGESLNDSMPDKNWDSTDDDGCAICADDYHDSDQWICDDCNNELESLKADQEASRWD